MPKPEPVYEDSPQPGFYRTRNVKGGPWLPVIVWREPPEIDEVGDLMSDEVLLCMIDGKPANPYDRWLVFARNPISAEEYFALFAASSAPGAPPTNLPVDPLTDAPIF